MLAPGQTKATTPPTINSMPAAIRH